MAWQAWRRKPGPRLGPARCGRRRPRLDARRESRRSSGCPVGLPLAARGSLEAAGWISSEPESSPGLRAAGPIPWARGGEDGCDLPPGAAEWKWPSTWWPGFRDEAWACGAFQHPSRKLLLLGCSSVRFLTGVGRGGRPDSILWAEAWLCGTFVSGCCCSLYLDEVVLGGALLCSWNS